MSLLRIKIYRTYDRLILTQAHYLDKILDKFSKSNNSIDKTTIDTRVFIFKNKGERMSQLEYS